MNDLLKELKEWSAEVKKNPVSKWNDLPDIELYMDQVINYIEKQLQIYQEQEETKLITSSMINNYVKNGVIKHANSKKYSKEHLGSLIMIGLLKQVLPLSQISKLTGIFNTADNKADIYDTFLKIQKDALNGVLVKLDDEANTQDSDNERLFMTAIRLSCEAFANRIAAEKIFKMINVNNYNSTEDKKEEKVKSKKEIKKENKINKN